MGHYIWRNAPTLVEQQQQVQLNTLHSKVATCLKHVNFLKRPIAHSTNRCTRCHGKDTIACGPTQPPPTLRGTSPSPLESTTQKEETRVHLCDISDAYHDAPHRLPQPRSCGLPKSSGVYHPVSPSGFQKGLRNHYWTSKQLQAARKMAMQVIWLRFPAATTPLSSAWLSSQLIASGNPYLRLQHSQLFGTPVHAFQLPRIAKTLSDQSTLLAPSLSCKALQKDCKLKAKVMCCGQCRIPCATFK